MKRFVIIMACIIFFIFLEGWETILMLGLILFLGVIAMLENIEKEKSLIKIEFS